MIIVAVFLDNIDSEQSSRFRGNREPFCQTFLATFRLLKDWRLVTLIPLTMYSGFEQSFLSGEYTKVKRSPRGQEAHAVAQLLVKSCREERLPWICSKIAPKTTMYSFFFYSSLTK